MNANSGGSEGTCIPITRGVLCTYEDIENREIDAREIMRISISEVLFFSIVSKR